MISFDQIRKYAIHKLSTDFILSPIEKVDLGRAHRIATWMEEGVTSLVKSDIKPTLHDLATLGWETAARILWIRDDFTPVKILRFRKDAIKCGNCSSSSRLINFDFNCSSCGRLITENSELTVPGVGANLGPTDPMVKSDAIQCNHSTNCRGDIFAYCAVRCPCCPISLSLSRNVRITQTRRLKEMIRETFREEVKSYEVT
jgi:hypothetical protein